MKEKQLKQVIDELEISIDRLKDLDITKIRLEERYKTLSELDADPSSKHRMHIKINKMMKETIKQIQKNESSKNQ